MVTIAFLALLALSCMVALADWRRGWFLAFLCGVLQDPARKMTPGTPVVLTMSILAVYAMILFAAQRPLKARYRDLTRRYGMLDQALGIVMIFLILATLRGAMTFGLALWTVPALSLFIYLAPLPAVLLGYAWATDEASIVRFLQFYPASDWSVRAKPSSATCRASRSARSPAFIARPTSWDGTRRC